MAEAFAEEALANLKESVGNQRHGRFRKGAGALIKRAERRAQGAAITFQDGSMATLSTQEGGLTAEMAVHHSSGPGALAGGRRTSSPLPTNRRDELARARPKGRNGPGTEGYCGVPGRTEATGGGSIEKSRN